MKKILWLDTETTGLDATKHGIIQLAMLMDIDGKLVDEISLDIQPFENDMMSIGFDDISNMPLDFIWFESKQDYSDAKTPTGITFANIAEFMSPDEAYAEIIIFLNKHIAKFDKTDKAYIGGYNVNFDRDFISAFFKKIGDKYLGSFLNWKCLDPMYNLWEMDYKGETSFENYKLATVAETYGIPLEAHNAMSDIKATRELWYKLQEANNGTHS